jgi:hypothetical protein
MRSKRRNPAILAPDGHGAGTYGLRQKRLNFDPASPTWPNRDRFILSAGHASKLLYVLHHLTKTQAVNAEYETLGRSSGTLDDIKSFRQPDTACPGHPNTTSPRRRSDDGTARPGRGDERRLGDGGTLVRHLF